MEHIVWNSLLYHRRCIISSIVRNWVRVFFVVIYSLSSTWNFHDNCWRSFCFLLFLLCFRRRRIYNVLNEVVFRIVVEIKNHRAKLVNYFHACMSNFLKVQKIVLNWREFEKNMKRFEFNNNSVTVTELRHSTFSFWNRI
jgi:hypothetical protein